jgi:hypothetical protein
MKIFTDIQNITRGKTQQAAIPARNKAPELDIPGQRNSIRTTTEMRNAVRAFQSSESMSEALNIAQIASTVIQRAVELSSRLRNIALDAMATSRLNNGAVEEVSAEFRSALQGVPEKYNALVTAPQMRPDVAGDLASNVRNDTSGISIQREITAFKKTVGGMMENSPASEAATRDLQTLMLEKGRQVNTYIGELEGTLNTIAGSFSALKPDSAAAQVLKTADMIVNNYTSAMTAQGNIIKTNVLGA